jgi:hypothetical protein
MYIVCRPRPPASDGKADESQPHVTTDVVYISGHHAQCAQGQSTPGQPKLQYDLSSEHRIILLITGVLFGTASALLQCVGESSQGGLGEKKKFGGGGGERESGKVASASCLYL